MKGRYRIRWFRLGLLVIVGYCLYVFVGQQVELNAINREADLTRVRLQQQQQTNQALTEEKARLADPAYIEKLAREELGLVKPGEVPYVQPGKN